MQKELHSYTIIIFLLTAVSQYKGLQAGKEMWRTCKSSANSEKKYLLQHQTVKDFTLKFYHTSAINNNNNVKETDYVKNVHNICL